MATLEKIRNHAGLLVIIVGLALFAFILNDALNSGSTYMRQSHDEVVNVNGTPIKQMEYNYRIEEMMDVFRIQSQTNSIPDEYKDQINQNVYDMMVREIIMKEDFDKLGIYVTPEELFDMVEGENVSSMAQQFPLFIDETGAYSKARALDVLKSFDNLDAFPATQRVEVERLRNYWLFWERNMKTQRLQEKYTGLLAKAFIANPLDAKDAYESSRESSDIIYAMQPYSTVADSLVEVSNSEIRKLYNERKEQYRQKEGRTVDYIAVEVVPSEADYAAANADADALKADMVDTDDIESLAGTTSNLQYLDAFVSSNAMDAEMKAFAEKAQVGEVDGPAFIDNSYNIYKLIDKTLAPDSLKVSHIFLTSQTGVVDSAMTATADSLLAVLKNGGDFAALAAQYSLDDQTKANGGEIGWMTELAALQAGGKELKDGIFNAPLNQPTILKASYGIHILKVTEKTANVEKYKIAYAHIDVTPSNKTYSDTYNKLNQYISANNTPEKMQASAAEAGYNLISNVRIATTDRIIGAVPNSRSVIRWAFEGTKKNEVSNIIDCNNRFVVVVRKDVVPEGYQSINSVAALLRSELAMKKKGTKIAEGLKARNLQSIEAYADAMGSPIDTVKFITMETQRLTRIGMEPVLNAEVAFAKPHQLCAPVVGNNGVYAFVVINRTQEGGDYDEKAQITSLELQNSYRSYQAVQQLVDDAKIIDNRIRFE